MASYCVTVTGVTVSGYVCTHLMFHNLQMLLEKFSQDFSKHHLWIDDVFVTGILAKRAGVRHK